MTSREIVQSIAELFGMEKVAWSRAIKACNQCLSDGFTADDILKAAVNMSRLDKKYWSIYSLFNKIDYWYNKAPDEKEDKNDGTW